MGQHSNWRQRGGDTPPGLYKLGQCWNDVDAVGRSAPYQLTLMQYGWQTYDMIDLEGHEDRNGRAGICLHGGGSACGWPMAWAARQPLYATVGCVRMHNEDLKNVIHPLYKQGTVFISVHQDEK
jgi:L,D-peptidoglycan transpeptidase YkuD (ErfK/YbiS/YcfS/YnhG family)